MTFSKNKTISLFIADIFLFYITLILMLSISYFPFPRIEIIIEHIIAFTVLIVIWILSFFIAGLYEKNVLFFRKKLATILFKTQVVNIIIAVFFFYFIPFFSITPKTNLFIYLIISSVLIVVWRLYVSQLINNNNKLIQAVIIAEKEEIKLLIDVVNKNPLYGLKFVDSYDVRSITEDDLQKLMKSIRVGGVSHMIVDMNADKSDELSFSLYNFLFSGVHVIDINNFYEDLFERVPSSLLSYRWFIENIPFRVHPLYDFLRRMTDIVVSLVFGIVTLPLYPLVYIAVKIDDGGSLFFFQNRVGKGNVPIKIVKFRSMSKEGTESSVTRVGSFLRKTRIDELPQLWNVLKGDLSLIGPRPEIEELALEYQASIPYYNIRSIIKPGLSGWAQLFHENHPHHGSDIEETKIKLSYDLYYIKNRSFILDVVILLKTIRTLLSQSGK